MRSFWWKLFKELSQKLLWLQIREDGDIWQICLHETVLLHRLNKSILDQYSLACKGRALRTSHNFNSPQGLK